jgi:hypothetical protein
MKTGPLLRTQLGLDGYEYVLVSRAVVSSQKILFVYYDSYRKNMPITLWRLRKFPWVAHIFSGTNLYHGTNKKTTYTPPQDIDDYNGNLKGILVVAVNLAGDRFIDKKDFSKKFEARGADPGINLTKTPHLSLSGKLNEFVTLYDLRDKGNISQTTSYFRKRRNKIMGLENTTAKLIDCFINEADRSVTFAFLTTVTEDDELYGPDFEYKETDPKKGYPLTVNRSKTYEVQIKVLEFFDWMETHPNIDEITRKEVKEILQVSNIQVSSTSPSFNWQGFAYWLTQIDAAIYPQSIKPKQWDKIHGDGEAFIDKHVYGLLRSIDFFLNPMSSMLSKKLKARGLLVKEK